MTNWSNLYYSLYKGVREVIKIGKKILIALVLCMVFTVSTSTKSFAIWGWDKKEIKTENVAINFAREVERGGYKIISTDELKGWFDQKKEILIYPGGVKAWLKADYPVEKVR